MIRRTGTRTELTQKLIALPTGKSLPNSQHVPLQSALVSQASRLERDCTEIGKKLSIESDTVLAEIFRTEFMEKSKQLKSVRAQLASYSELRGTAEESTQN